MFVIIAVDHGNARIKTPHFGFVSGLTDYTVLPPLADDVIEYNGKFWALTGERIPYMRDKTQDDRFYVLTLFAIAKEIKRMKAGSFVEGLELAAGLPPEHFGALKNRFREYLSRSPVRFKYNSEMFQFTVANVHLYPQGYAAIAKDIDRICAYSSVYLVDIGGYTTDVWLLRQGQADLQVCYSLEAGTIPLTRAVARKVNAQHDMRIEENHILDVLQGKSTILPYPVQLVIRETVAAQAVQILNSLREIQVNLRSTPVIFSGGGAIMLKPYIEASQLVSHAEFILDPNATAVGYEILTTERLRLKAQGGRPS